MAKATVAGEIHQTLDVHRCVAAKIAFYSVARIDSFADLQNFGIRKVLHTTAMINSQLSRDFDGFSAADTVNVGKRNDHALVGWNVNSGNTCQFIYSCSTGVPERTNPISTLMISRNAQNQRTHKRAAGCTRYSELAAPYGESRVLSRPEARYPLPLVLVLPSLAFSSMNSMILPAMSLPLAFSIPSSPGELFTSMITGP